MRSADTTATIAAALRGDHERLTEILCELPAEDAARLIDAGRFITEVGGRVLSQRIADSAEVTA
jgi:hypothetical protein